MIIIAVDPGISTGIAIKKDGQYITCTLSLEATHDGQLRNLLAHANHVVYEDFVAYKSHYGKVDKNGFETVRIIGRMQEQCGVNKTPMTKYAAQNRLAFIPKAREMLKTNKVVCNHPTRHECDALAHLLRYEYEELKRVR